MQNGRYAVYSGKICTIVQGTPVKCSCASYSCNTYATYCKIYCTLYQYCKNTHGTSLGFASVPLIRTILRLTFKEGFKMPPLSSAMSEDAETKPRTVATMALAVRHSYHSARSHPKSKDEQFIAHQNPSNYLRLRSELCTGYWIVCTTEYTEWQRPLSGAHSVMMEKLAQAGEGWGFTSILFHYIYHHIQSCSVGSSWQGRYTPPISSLPLDVLCD